MVESELYVNKKKIIFIDRLLVALVILTTVTSAFCQRLNFLTSSPNIDKFPLITLSMTASYNGTLPNPTLQASDFTVTEDGKPVNIQLQNCDDSREAAVVFCVDASSSMVGSAGDLFDVYESFFTSFGSCITEFTGSTRYGLVTFTDVIAGVYPPASHPGGLYFSKNATDSAAFVAALRIQPFAGGTNADVALYQAISMLQYTPFQQRAIVLVTDDSPLDIWTLDSLMKAFHITLYVMEVGSDPSPHGLTLSHWTGGTYFQAKDSTDFAPVMSQLGELISGEHCLISYTSPNPCPWYADHNINLQLNYKGISRTVAQTYTLGKQKNDIAAPTITEFASSFISRRVVAEEDFPCGRGLRIAEDSVKENFILLSRNQKFKHYFPKIGGVYRDSNYVQLQDSLLVSDTLQPARAIYTAYDSSGNRNAIEILYQPKADILPPELNNAQSSGGKYTIAATEVRPWDRGLVSIKLAAGAQNFVLDSVRIFSKKSANAWVHVIDLTQVAHCCIEATDTAGNVGTFCIDRTTVTADTLPPIIVQNPITEPRVMISGVVTETRAKDTGIKQIVMAPSANVGALTVNYVNTTNATFTVPILDSLQPVRAVISASDIVGNAALDTLRYDPLPDVNAPVCSIDASSPTVRVFKSSELAPWDRGIASVTIVGAPLNFTLGAVIYKSRSEAEQTFTIIDPSKPASVVVKATDSAGQHCISNISIDATQKSLIPLQVQASVDFLTHLAPFDSIATITITNPNETPVVITKISQTGDGSAFTSSLVTGLIFQALEQKTINIHFNSSLIGKWASTFTIGNDTLTLAKIASTAITTGIVTINIVSIQTLHSQLPETLVISVSAIPTPINLDLLEFDLHFDGDLVLPSLPMIDCSSPNEFCNYSITTSSASPGTLHCTLSRTDINKLATLAFTNAQIKIPFTTFVSKNKISSVTITGASGGQYCSVVSDSGLISQGDECGDPALRAAMNNTLEGYIHSITPNPASTNATIQIISSESDQSATLSLVDQLGSSLIHQDVILKVGVNNIVLPLSAIAQGRYIVVLQKGHSIRNTMPINIVR